MRRALIILACGAVFGGCQLFPRDQRTAQDVGPQAARSNASVADGGVATSNTSQTTSQDSRSVQNDPWPIVAVVGLAVFAVGLSAWFADRRLDHWTRKHGYTPDGWAAKQRWTNGGDR